MVSKRFLVIIASVIIAWLLLNGMNYRLISSFNQINEDVVSIYDSISTASLLQYKIVNFYMEMGRFPISNEELGIGAPETFNRRATSKITIGPEGIIEVSLKDIVDEKASIFLKPYLSYTGIGSEIDWQCFSYTVTQDHFDHGPLSQSCVYRQNNLPPPPPSQPSWAVTNSENFILAIHRKRRAVILRMLREGIDVNTPVNDELPMQAAIDEMSRRREIQLAYNREHNITPRSIKRAIEVSMEDSKISEFDSKVMEEEAVYESGKTVLELILELEKKMLSAAKNLDFEVAAELRDRIKGLREKDLKIIL